MLHDPPPPLLSLPYACRKLGGAGAALLLLWPAAAELGGSPCFILLLTATHVFVWNASTDSVIKEFIIKDSKILRKTPRPTIAGHSKHSAQVELWFTTCREAGGQKEICGRKQQDFEMVEQYLQLTGSRAGEEEMYQPETVLVAEDVVEEMVEGEGDEGESHLCSRDEDVSHAVECGEGDHGGEDDLLVCLEEHEAAQFLAVLNLIKTSFPYPDNLLA